MSAHHAYFVTGDIEEGITSALTFVKETLALETNGNPDVLTLRHGLFSVEDARLLQSSVMRAPVRGDTKAIIVSATRFFHEAQNALLKTFEEPSAGTVIVLIVPSEGMLLPTLRSRLVSLPDTSSARSVPDLAVTYLALGKEERDKLTAKIVERAKSEKDREKAGARADALSLVEGLTVAVYATHTKAPSPELTALLLDLDRFTPILHDRSAPLKLIFEHLTLVVPRRL